MEPSFHSIDSNKDGFVDKEELTGKLSAEDEGFKTSLVEAGLHTNFEVLEQIDGDSDKRVTWDDFYGKLKEAATAEIKATADVAAATEIKATSDEWVKKVDVLLKEWTLLDNTVTELNSWVAKDKSS